VKISERPKYLFQLTIAMLVLAGVFVFGGLWLRDEPVRKKERDDSPVIVFFPHGRVLYVVVENDGAYIGEEFIPFLLFDQFIKDHKRTLAPDYFIVIGTSEARYGNAVEVFASLRKIIGVDGTMRTYPAEPGTRRPAIASYRHCWDYDY